MHACAVDQHAVNPTVPMLEALMRRENHELPAIQRNLAAHPASPSDGTIGGPKNLVLSVHLSKAGIKRSKLLGLCTSRH